MREEGARDADIRRALVAFDSRGLLREGALRPSPTSKSSPCPSSDAELRLDPDSEPTPTDVIRAVRPTILVGATARAARSPRK